MLKQLDRHARCFQIGVVPVSLRTSIGALHKQYTSLYRDFQVAECPGDPIRIAVQPSPFSLRHRRRYEISVNGRPRFAPARFDEVLPYVEWAINWELAEVMPQYLQLHASSMEVDGQGVIFPGISGSGKSTLTVALLTRGWRYLCDEFALIHTDTLDLHPYPRAICIKKAAFPVAESLGLIVKGGRHHHKGTKGEVVFLNPLVVHPHAIGRAVPIGFVVFPRYARGAEPTLIPISRAEAALDLHHVCFNLFGCRALGVDVLAAMVRGVSCYRLISGEIGKTCDLIEQLVGRTTLRHARTA